MISNRFLFFFGIFFLFAFVLFTLIIKTHVLDSFDFNTTVRIQNHIPQKFYAPFSILSLIGTAEVMTVFLLFTLPYLKLRFIPVITLYGIGGFIEIVGKEFLRHPGPPYLFFKYDLKFLFPSSYIHTLHSYPSGHSFRTIFVIFVIITILLPRLKDARIRTLVLLAAAFFGAAMMVSRIALGEHWTTDVIGGMFLGFSFAAFSVFMTRLQITRHPMRN